MCATKRASDVSAQSAWTVGVGRWEQYIASLDAACGARRQLCKCPQPLRRLHRSAPPGGPLVSANRGEIAIRICRAARDGHQDRRHLLQGRPAACTATRPTSPSRLAPQEPGRRIPVGGGDRRAGEEEGVDAIHPGYGFLSENTKFVQLCEEAGIIFIGPLSKVIHRWDKTENASSRWSTTCRSCPAPRRPCRRWRRTAFCDEVGYPVICKAAFGGGGREHARRAGARPAVH